MFTGIVEELGAVDAVRVDQGGGRLTVRAPKISGGLNINDSVATNGVCLTVVAADPNGFSVDLAPETLARTNLGRLRPGDRLCLERAATLTTRLGGHLVQGHIDGQATIIERQREGIQHSLRFESSPSILRYIVAKGFVAVDGVSLTVVDSAATTFSIALIPHSAELTTLGFKRAGDSVNVEVDVIGKYVERFVAAQERSTRPSPGD